MNSSNASQPGSSSSAASTKFVWSRPKFFKKKQSHFHGRAQTQLEVIELASRLEMAIGGTALIYRLIYSNGWREVEKSLTPKYQTKLEYENLQRREFEILSELNHPLIIRPVRLRPQPALGGGTTNVLFLEYLDGVSLAELWDFVRSLDSVPRLNWAYEILGQLSSVVSYLGKNGIVHGDIAPENIIIQKNGLIKLLDFGVATREGEGSLSFMVAGRNYFRAPELRSSGGTSHKGDVFAVGRIFEQLLGDGAAEESPHRELLKRVTEQRELPPISFDESGWFPGLSPMPPAEKLEPKVRLRPKTKLTPRPSFFDKHRKVLLTLGVFVSVPFISSFQPRRAKITVNTLPYSSVIFVNVNAQIQYETPVIGLSVPSGEHIIEIIIPEQNHRHVTRHIAVLPGDHAKLFEDFRNLDTLKK